MSALENFLCGAVHARMIIAQFTSVALKKYIMYNMSTPIRTLHLFNGCHVHEQIHST